MERYKRIYDEMKMLFDDISSKDTFGYSMTFTSKMVSLEIMHRETLKKVKHLEIVAKEESDEGKVALIKTTRAWYEAIALFEAYLNSFILFCRLSQSSHHISMEMIKIELQTSTSEVKSTSLLKIRMWTQIFPRTLLADWDGTKLSGITAMRNS